MKHETKIDLFALPKFRNDSAYEKDLLPAADEVMTLKPAGIPRSVTLLHDGSPVPFTYEAGVLTVTVSASKRSNLPDVVRVELPR